MYSAGYITPFAFSTANETWTSDDIPFKRLRLFKSMKMHAGVDLVNAE
jgi:hypothetical protein